MCKGIVFRHYRSTFFKSYIQRSERYHKTTDEMKKYERKVSRLENRNTLHLLVNDSCPGCEECKPVRSALIKWQPDFTHVSFASMIPKAKYVATLDYDEKLVFKLVLKESENGE